MDILIELANGPDCSEEERQRLTDINEATWLRYHNHVAQFIADQFNELMDELLEEED